MAAGADVSVTKAQIINLHLEHMDWSARRLAQELGCSDAYVRKLSSLYGLKLPRGIRSKSKPKPAPEFKRASYAGAP